MIVIALTALLLGKDGDSLVVFGGSPRVMGGGGRVRMVRETVDVKILPVKAEFEGTFVIQNLGAGCDITVGYPDRFKGFMETVYAQTLKEAVARKERVLPFDGLQEFKSFLDGTETRSELVPDHNPKLPMSAWHLQKVHLNAHQTRTLRIRYTNPFSFVRDDQDVARQYAFALSTGSNWAGSIGSVTLNVTYDEGEGVAAKSRVPKRLASTEIGSKATITRLKSLPKGTLVYKFPTAPSQQKNRLTFKAQNLKGKSIADWVITSDCKTIQQFDKEEREAAGGK